MECNADFGAGGYGRLGPGIAPSVFFPMANLIFGTEVTGTKLTPHRG